MEHKLTREFDGASLLAPITPLDQLNPTIANLQRIRHNAEDVQVPDFLNTLKQYQLTHMNMVINIMLGFLGEQIQNLSTRVSCWRESSMINTPWNWQNY